MKDNLIQIFHIEKHFEEDDRYVVVAHGKFDGSAERQLKIHGSGVVSTVLGDYSGITTYLREYTIPKPEVERLLDKFQRSAKRAGMKRIGMMRIRR